MYSFVVNKICITELSVECCFVYNSVTKMGYPADRFRTQGLHGVNMFGTAGLHTFSLRKTNGRNGPALHTTTKAIYTFSKTTVLITLAIHALQIITSTNLIRGGLNE